MAKTAARARKKEKKNVVTGVAHVNATFNNTIITITDGQGNAISWSSAGSLGFKGSNDATRLRLPPDAPETSSTYASRGRVSGQARAQICAACTTGSRSEPRRSAMRRRFTQWLPGAETARLSELRPRKHAFCHRTNRASFASVGKR